jgi:type II secretory pathway component GspD/PulD (secretin)
MINFAQPTLVTESGRTANLRVGSEIPAPNGGTLFCGNKIDLNSRVEEKEIIQVEFRLCINELDEKNSVNVNGTTFPGVKSFSVNTSCKIKNGETVALGGLITSQMVDVPNAPSEKKNGVKEKDKSENDSEKVKKVRERTLTLVLIKPEIVETMAVSERTGGLK